MNAGLIEKTTKDVFGSLGTKSRKILGVLQQDLEIHLYAEDFATATNIASHTQKNSRKAGNEKSDTKISLSAVLYGPVSLFDDVGNFAATCGFYLQHPIYCDLDVPYRNPHCLRPVGGDVSTFEMLRMLDVQSVSPDTYSNPIDMFAELDDHNALSETSPPDSISRQLYPHQKQALTFMLQREAGWALTSSSKDVWKKEIDHNGQHWYMNTVTGSQHRREPPAFKGGLLIDAPGLGKSLSILSLIATDLQSAEFTGAGLSAVSNTLLVVPNSRNTLS